jgi:hypothetical protein
MRRAAAVLGAAAASAGAVAQFWAMLQRGPAHMQGSEEPAGAAGGTRQFATFGIEGMAELGSVCSGRACPSSVAVAAGAAVAVCPDGAAAAFRPGEDVAVLAGREVSAAAIDGRGKIFLATARG